MFPEERSLVEEMQGRPFVLIGINTDSDIEVARKSVKKNKLNWRSFFDARTRRITSMFNVRAFPTVMLIDHTGKIAFPNLRGPKLIPEIKTLVKAAEQDGMVGEKKAPEMRTFKDSTGKHRIEAIAEAINSENVRLQKKNGESLTMKLEDLSRSDRKYLKTVDLPAFTSGDVTEGGGEYRTFVDSTGKHEIEAQFIELDNGKVKLLKRDGSTTEVPLDRLSDKDQEFVKQQDSGS